MTAKGAFAGITHDPNVMGESVHPGPARDSRNGAGLLAAGRSPAEIIEAYPHLERDDIDRALANAAWRLEERELPIANAWPSSS